MEAESLQAKAQLTQVEDEFVVLKNQYFAAQVEAVRKEMAQLADGTHEQYLAKQERLMHKHRDALETAARERAYQIHNAQVVYEIEVSQSASRQMGVCVCVCVCSLVWQMLQAEKDLDMDKKHLKKKMREALEHRLEELEEERKVRAPSRTSPLHSTVFCFLFFF